MPSQTNQGRPNAYATGTSTGAPSLFNPTVSSLNIYLFMWGPSIQFEVQPLNIHEYDHETETDWAHKEIAGAAIYREWVGENDEVVAVRGRVFPYRIGGMSALDDLDSQRRKGIANPLIRGDGRSLGYYVCEKLVRAHTYLSSEGIGQQIAFEAMFVRVPTPSGGPSSFSNIWSTIGAGGG